MKKRILRILDANFNRCREGIRVCEDIARFIFNDKKLTSAFKRARHKLRFVFQSLPFSTKTLIKMRDSECDVGRESDYPKKIKHLEDVFMKNVKRSEESLRVMEELARLYSVKASEQLTKLRFRVYELEKKLIKKF